MKKILIAILVLLVAIGAGAGGGFLYKKNKTKKSDFVWAVQCNVYSLYKPGEHSDKKITEAKIKYLKQLGVSTVRVNFESHAVRDPNFRIIPHDQPNDYYINALHKNGFDIILVIDPSISPELWDFDFEDEGYKIASYAAQRYFDKVKYFQTANEITGTIANANKTGRTGANFKDEFGMSYNQKVYNQVFDWTRGMQKGVRQYAPSSKLILSGHFVLYEVINRFIKDGSDFDILGWSWYDDSDGTSVFERLAPDGKTKINLAEKLKGLGKDVWIIEANSYKGTYTQDKTTKDEAEAKQAKFISEFATQIKNSGYFKGFVVFELFDYPINKTVLNQEQEAYWGLVEVTVEPDNINIIKRKKPAFNAYRDVIRSSR